MVRKMRGSRYENEGKENAMSNAQENDGFKLFFAKKELRLSAALEDPKSATGD